jgi:hypothetical protein
VGPTCQLGAERGKGSLVRGRFPVVEAETEWVIGGANEPAGLGEEGSSLGRRGLVRWLGSAGLKSKENLFGIKIGFLNLSRLWKFVQGDLGGT